MSSQTFCSCSLPIWQQLLMVSLQIVWLAKFAAHLLSSLQLIKRYGPGVTVITHIRLLPDANWRRRRQSCRKTMQNCRERKSDIDALPASCEKNVCVACLFARRQKVEKWSRMRYRDWNYTCSVILVFTTARRLALVLQFTMLYEVGKNAT